MKHPERHDRWQINRMADGIADDLTWPQPPCFFTPSMHNLWLGGRYADQSCFLVCGGPSATPGVLERVRACRGAVVMAINNAAQDIRPDLWIGLDEPKRFLTRIWVHPLITKFYPLSYSDYEIPGLGKTPRQCADVVLLRRNDDFNFVTWFTEPTINWGQNGDATTKGGRSTMVAAMRVLHILGFRNVFLVGADFHMDVGPGAYSHAQQADEVAARKNNALFHFLNTSVFPKLVDASGTLNGMRVYNTNRESKLTAFPFMSLDEALKLTSAELDGLMAQTSAGLYDGHFKPEGPTRRDKVMAYHASLSPAEVDAAWRRYLDNKALVDADQHTTADLVMLEDRAHAAAGLIPPHGWTPDIPDAPRSSNNFDFVDAPESAVIVGNSAEWAELKSSLDFDINSKLVVRLGLTKLSHAGIAPGTLGTRTDVWVADPSIDGFLDRIPVMLTKLKPRLVVLTVAGPTHPVLRFRFARARCAIEARGIRVLARLKTAGTLADVAQHLLVEQGYEGRITHAGTAPTPKTFWGQPTHEVEGGRL